jgi:hypothetical protein
MLANTTHPSLSGTSVYWDFVELQSSNGKLVLSPSFGIIRNIIKLEK